MHPHLLQLGWACFVYFPSEFDPLYVGRDPGAAVQAEEERVQGGTGRDEHPEAQRQDRFG